MLGEQAYCEEIDTREDVKKQGGSTKSDDFSTEAVKFDWCDKWLKGEEYYQILTHTELYSKVYSFKKYPPKAHPQTTYTNPTSKFHW